MRPNFSGGPQVISCLYATELPMASAQFGLGAVVGVGVVLESLAIKSFMQWTEKLNCENEEEWEPYNMSGIIQQETSYLVSMVT